MLEERGRLIALACEVRQVGTGIWRQVHAGLKEASWQPLLEHPRRSEQKSKCQGRATANECRGALAFVQRETSFGVSRNLASKEIQKRMQGKKDVCSIEQGGRKGSGVTVLVVSWKITDR